MYANLSYDGDVTPSCNSEESVGTSNIASNADARLTPEGTSKVTHVQGQGPTADGLSPIVRHRPPPISPTVPLHHSHVTTQHVQLVPLRPTANSKRSTPVDVTNAVTPSRVRRESADGDSMRVLYDNKHTAGLSADQSDYGFLPLSSNKRLSHPSRDVHYSQDNGVLTSAPPSADWSSVAPVYTDNVNYDVSISGDKPRVLSNHSNTVKWLPPLTRPKELHKATNDTLGMESKVNTDTAGVPVKHTLSSSVFI